MAGIHYGGLHVTAVFIDLEGLRNTSLRAKGLLNLLFLLKFLWPASVLVCHLELEIFFHCCYLEMSFPVFILYKCKALLIFVCVWCVCTMPYTDKTSVFCILTHQPCHYPKVTLDSNADLPQIERWLHHFSRGNQGEQFVSHY